MSQINLLSESFFRLPSIPNITHTLQLIETQKNFLPNSIVSLDRHISEPLDHDDQELSIDNKMPPTPNEVVTQTSITKKKKMGCTCKKTKCLKMYCECFREGKLCTEDCSCYGCSNDEGHSHALQKARETLSHKLLSAKHQGKGCSCKKTQCIKKYCECFNSGIGCGEACRCENCANGPSEENENEFISASKSLVEFSRESDSIPPVLKACFI